MHLAAVQCRLHMGSDGKTAIWSNGTVFRSLKMRKKSFFSFGHFLGVGGILAVINARKDLTRYVTIYLGALAFEKSARYAMKADLRKTAQFSTSVTQR